MTAAMQTPVPAESRTSDLSSPLTRRERRQREAASVAGQGIKVASDHDGPAVARAAVHARPRPARPRPELVITVQPAGTTGRRSDARRRTLAAVAASFAFALTLTVSIPAVAAVNDDDTAQPLQMWATTQQLQVEGQPAADLAGPASFGVVQNPYAAALLDPQQTASLEAVTSSAAGNYFDANPAYDEAWSQLSTTYVQTPFPSRAELPISSPFAPRWGKFHYGLDIPLAQGEPIFPVANGVVTAVFQGDEPGGGGYMVVVEHNIDGRFFQSWYAHMQAGSIDVDLGDVVTLDTQLGAVGSTGNSTGPHLHLEIKNPDYESIDPVAWMDSRAEVTAPGGY